jgi:GDP-L-fucose synthase
MDKKAKIYVAGHRGLVGSAIVRRLTAEGYENIITRTRQEVDLMDAAAVTNFYEQEKPEFVFVAAAKVGGILANKDAGADFIYDNLVIQNNLIHGAYKNNVTKLLFLGSSCIYPKLAPQPIKEDSFLDGKLEETNAPYAVAKIAGITMCQAFNKQYGTNYISAMPTNLYGPNDNFNLQSSHVLPALLRKVHEAKLNSQPTVTVWGSGKPMREFLYVDDLADACLFLMNNYDNSEIINVGTGVDVTIRDLALTIMKVVGYEGEMVFDNTKPDGTPRKLMDVSKINALDWKAEHDLESGLRKTYEWLLEHPEVLT